ncbi:MAG TPA: outer membrane beta-barrel protein [Nitrospira sp.]|nr:outer membrane beta-barrel protein [Nitrospira sp.]HPV82809.1 outer membrane beta-barrel protein [Nitrospira sp.]
MGSIRDCVVSGKVLLFALVLNVVPAVSQAVEWTHEGMADEGKVTMGFRVGPSFMTQSSGVGTVGPALNFQGMYGLNKWFRLGMMLEWESHSIDGPRSGSVDTITLLPLNLEYRPGHFGNFIPYFTTGLGVNINTKDVSDTFAWRIGGGIDYALSNLVQSAPKGLMLNMETAWKRNHPSGGDGSSMGLLFGVRHTF